MTRPDHGFADRLHQHYGHGKSKRIRQHDRTFCTAWNYGRYARRYHYPMRYLPRDFAWRNFISLRYRDDRDRWNS